MGFKTPRRFKNKQLYYTSKLSIEYDKQQNNKVF